MDWHIEDIFLIIIPDYNKINLNYNDKYFDLF